MLWRPRAYLDALRRTGRCLVVLGSALGLDRPDLYRIDRMLASGGAVAGVVPFSAGG